MESLNQASDKARNKLVYVLKEHEPWNDVKDQFHLVLELSPGSGAALPHFTIKIGTAHNFSSEPSTQHNTHSWR